MRIKENKLRIQGTTMRRRDNKLPLQKKAPLGVCGACYPFKGHPHRKEKQQLYPSFVSYAFKSFGFNKQGSIKSEI